MLVDESEIVGFGRFLGGPRNIHNALPMQFGREENGDEQAVGPTFSLPCLSDLQRAAETSASGRNGARKLNITIAKRGPGAQLKSGKGLGSTIFPANACLEIDILRDSTGGKLFVIELSVGGAAWHFSGERSKSYDPRFLRSLYTQFNALDLVADLLIEKTRAEAS